jgi:hypothetical protein
MRVIAGARSRLHELFERVVIAYWRRREPVEVPGRSWSMAPSDNVQQTMNLVMPLRSTSPVELAKMAAAVSSVSDVLSTGLDNIGTVHVARFDVVRGNLCMISVYDGDFATYIRDFVVSIGPVFNLLMDFVVDPPTIPVEDHVDEFVDWVDRHDLLQMGNLLHLSEDLAKVPRAAVLLLDQKPDVQLGVYRAYPGFSVAQIRKALGIGW